MPSFDILKESTPSKSFRVASIIGRFDLQSNKISERFSGTINIPDEWSIGLIVGASGSGKTTIAKQLFPESLILNNDYSHESIIDDMPENKSILVKIRKNAKEMTQIEKDTWQVVAMFDSPLEVMEVLVQLASLKSGIPMNWGYYCGWAYVYSPGDRAACRAALALAMPRSDIQQSEWFV